MLPLEEHGLAHGTTIVVNGSMRDKGIEVLKSSELNPLVLLKYHVNDGVQLMILEAYPLGGVENFLLAR
ncbi:hypothetical protein VNO78_22933 [Psophocarpus tetragonolobus]|uniref:Uncharacterized protein n=1 Tax=Psophocarpus tetragonolobus TaxID=3891 RepID=A0AAN9S2V7_PSOTE